VWYKIQMGAEKACCGRFVDADRWSLGSDGPQNDEGSNERVMAQWFAALTRLLDVGHRGLGATIGNREIQRVVGQLAVGKLDEPQQRDSQII
jgi:hypothetical protein